MLNALRGRRRALAAGLAATAALTAGLAAAASPSTAATGARADDAPVLVWDPIGPIGKVTDDHGNPPGGADVGRYFPQMLTVRGHTYATWADNRIDDPYGQRNPEVMLRVSGDDGRTWGTLRNLSAPDAPGAPGNDDWPPALAASDTSVLAVFPTKTAHAPYEPDLLTIARITGANGETVTRHTMDAQLYNLALAGSGSSYYLLGARSYYWQFTRSTDDGATFSTPVNLDALSFAPVCRVESPAMAATGSTVVLTFLNMCGNNNRPDVYSMVSTDAGSTWGTPTAVTDTPQQESAPSVRVDDATGRVTVAWQTIRSQYGRTLDVSTASLTGAGDAPAWSAPATVETHSTDSSDFGVDYSGPWVAPRFSGTGTDLTLYAPLSPTYLTSADRGTTWTAAGSLPNNGHTIVWLNRGVKDLFAWQAQDTQAWVSTLLHRPAAPAGVSASVDGSVVTLTWAPAAAGERVTGYVVTDQTGRQVASASGQATTVRVTGLAWGTAYTFTVTSANAAGTSDAAISNTVTLVGAPARPAKPTAVVKGRTVTLTWRPVDGHGSPVTGYRVERQVQGQAAGKATTVKGPKAVFKRLKPGRYSFRVSAQNAVGTSAPSSWATVRVKE